MEIPILNNGVAVLSIRLEPEGFPFDLRIGGRCTIICHISQPINELDFHIEQEADVLVVSIMCDKDVTIDGTAIRMTPQ